MNCFHHPHSVAVSSCPDCNKGLCVECSQQYSFPICRECNHRRIGNERIGIIKDFFIIFGGGALITFIMTNLPTKASIELPLTTVLLMFYTYSGLIAGWRFLNKITPEYFLFLPFIGWLIYFIVKMFISGILGIFILPYRIFMNIKRWRELSKIN